MPTRTKAARHLVRAFAAALDGLPDIKRTDVNGCPAVFVHSRMFAAVVGDELIIRLGPSDRRALLSVGGRRFTGGEGLRTRDFVVVPLAMPDAPPALRAWMEKAHAHAAARRV